MQDRPTNPTSNPCLKCRGRDRRHEHPPAVTLSCVLINSRRPMREKGRRGSLPTVKEVSSENVGRERWWTERLIALLRRRLDGEKKGFFFLIFILMLVGYFNNHFFFFSTHFYRLIRVQIELNLFWKFNSVLLWIAVRTEPRVDKIKFGRFGRFLQETNPSK